MTEPTEFDFHGQRLLVRPGRRRPSKRRLALSREVRFGDRPMIVTVGLDPAGTRVLEVFAATDFKPGAELATLLEDGAAALLSRCLQY